MPGSSQPIDFDPYIRARPSRDSRVRNSVSTPSAVASASSPNDSVSLRFANASPIASSTSSTLKPISTHTSLPHHHRPAEFQAATAAVRIAGKVRSIDLYRGTHLTTTADRNAHHIENHAVEVDENIFAKSDVESIVAEETRTYDSPLTNRSQTFGKHRKALDNGFSAQPVESQ
jgi:hypothetical protein